MDLVDRFECSKCKITFCLAHRLYEDHACPIQFEKKEGLLQGEYAAYEKAYRASQIKVN
jgi:predicted nucleic acid binding AN1-type Zn finger protein